MKGPPLTWRATLAMSALITNSRGGGSWPDMTHPVASGMACQFDGQVYGIELKVA
jgi:hypothetical protein